MKVQWESHAGLAATQSMGFMNDSLDHLERGFNSAHRLELPDKNAQQP
jgi:hypothetical protein